MALVALDGGIRIGPVRLVSATAGGAAAGADVTVVEEDRWLSLSAPGEREIVIETNPFRTHTGAMDAEPEALGSVVVRARGLWLAVVIDVDADVPCDPASVESVAAALPALMRAQGVRSALVALLGTRHGRLASTQSALAMARGFARAEAGPEVKVVVALAAGEKLVELFDR